MRVPLIIKNGRVSYETVLAWKVVWNKVCRMAYGSEKVVETIEAYPGKAIIDGVVVEMTEKDHSNFYQIGAPSNFEVITLDNTWKYYSSLHGTAMPKIVPEFTRLCVPRGLFESLGIDLWFQSSFPNCEIVFWDE
jgi:hypothetical protein